MRFFDRGSDIVVSTNERIDESISKRFFRAEKSGSDLKIFGHASWTQIYIFEEVEEPIEPDIDTLVNTLNTWSIISLRQKMTTEERLGIPNPTAGILPIYDTDLEEPFFYNGDKWITMSTLGIEGFFLSARGDFGTGGGWADSRFIELFPVLLFASNLTERAVYMFFTLKRLELSTVDPIVEFIVYSTSSPDVNDTIRWRLTTKYLSEGTSLSMAASQVLSQTQTLTVLPDDSRQSILSFTLDRSLISNQDVIHINLQRIGMSEFDTYGDDIGIGQSGIIVETNSHDIP